MLTHEPFSEDQGRLVVHPQVDSTNQLSCASRYYLPIDLHTCQTPWSMFQDGSNGEPIVQCLECADAKAHQRHALPATIKKKVFQESIDSPGFGRPQSMLVHARVNQRTSSSPFYIRPRGLGRCPAKDASPDYNSDDRAT
ncbi:hypothetical protein CQW23_31275 [Capsicum baccatum]|uniref:Uncharacterized protein n=1 Tax=Capsicum baccatum TaxID=33114 RepID=A0A2G2V855_CAPBA|nr:hypothetical protein CQW23_31275 [Capsicum baccatum]